MRYFMNKNGKGCDYSDFEGGQETKNTFINQVYPECRIKDNYLLATARPWIKLSMQLASKFR